MARERRQAIQHIVAVAVRSGRIAQRQPVAGFVIGVAHRDRRLIRRPGRGHRREPVGQIVPHRQAAVRVCHPRQIAARIIRVARHPAPRQGLAEQLIDGVIGKADRVALRGHTREEVVRPVVRVGLRAAQRVGRRGKAVLRVVRERRGV